jgi:ABC-2 type transport system ATP-binding protein
METPIPSLLSIQNVSKHYTNKTALNNINIEIPHGCIYGLLGPNGAGKTSLIRIINQITEADEGNVYLDGEKLAPKHIKSIGYLPEERGLYKKIKVITQLVYFAELRGLPRQEAISRANNWLKTMDLYDVRNKKIEELSKGMQQKIQFIVSIIHEPKLLILDEPFSGFDPINAELITSIILKLKSEGCTIIFSTHRMESVEKLCDYMAMIHLSNKVLDGKIKDIKKQFSKGTIDVESINPLEIDESLGELVQHSVNHSGHNVYTVKLKDISQNYFIQKMMDQSELISFQQYSPSINDIFIQLVDQNNAQHA